MKLSPSRMLPTWSPISSLFVTFIYFLVFHLRLRTTLSSSSLLSLISLSSLDLAATWLGFSDRSGKSSIHPSCQHEADSVLLRPLLSDLLTALIPIVSGLVAALLPLVSSLLANVGDLVTALGLGGLLVLLGLWKGLFSVTFLNMVLIFVCRRFILQMLWMTGRWKYLTNLYCMLSFPHILHFSWTITLVSESLHAFNANAIPVLTLIWAWILCKMCVSPYKSFVTSLCKFQVPGGHLGDARFLFLGLTWTYKSTTVDSHRRCWLSHPGFICPSTSVHNDVSRW